jgi:hypothetical protein
MPDFISQHDVDRLLQGRADYVSEDYWAEAFLKLDGDDNTHGSSLMFKTEISEDGNVASFSIPCGDWIYPSKDSTSRVQYSIASPLTLILFSTKGPAHKPDLHRGDVASHFGQSRRLHCTVNLNTFPPTLSFIKLTNDQEPEFVRELSNLVFEFNSDALDRRDDFNLSEGNLANSEVRWSICVASILLQHRMNFSTGTWGCGDELFFRSATIPEIESIGRW